MPPWYRNLYRAVANCVFYTICCPCILCICVGRLTCCPNILRDSHSIERHEQDSLERIERGREARRVRPLGPVRKRELSQAATSVVNEQKESVLFARLPAEIRTIIWHHVLGGRRYHLMQVPRRIGHHLCGGGPFSDPGRSCCLAAMAYWRQESGSNPLVGYLDRYFPVTPPPHADSDELVPLAPISDPHVLGLLQTCQRIYREAIDIPYRSNIFDIDDPETLLGLRQTIPRQRLRAVKSLRVFIEALYPPYLGLRSAPWYDRFDGLWTLMWHTIAHDMIGLESLELVIHSDSISSGWTQNHSPWAQKLHDVRGLNSFDLTVRTGRLSHDEQSDERMKVLIQRLRDSMYQSRVPTLKD